MWQTINLMVIFVAIIPTNNKYKQELFSYKPDGDFFHIIIAGITNNIRGIEGDKTLVPATELPFLPTPPVSIIAKLSYNAIMPPTTLPMIGIALNSNCNMGIIVVQIELPKQAVNMSINMIENCISVTSNLPNLRKPDTYVCQ